MTTHDCCLRALALSCFGLLFLLMLPHGADAEDWEDVFPDDPQTAVDET